MRNALIRNGITPEDLDKAYHEGFDEGLAAASPELTKTAYAAVALALKDEGYEKDGIIRVLSRMNDLILHTLDSIEAIDKVYRDLKLSLHLEDPLEPIKEMDT